MFNEINGGSGNGFLNRRSGVRFPSGTASKNTLQRSVLLHSWRASFGEREIAGNLIWVQKWVLMQCAPDDAARSGTT